MTDNNINNNEEEDLLSVNLSRRRSLQSNNNNNNNSRKSSSRSLQHYGQSIINNNNNSSNNAFSLSQHTQHRNDEHPVGIIPPTNKTRTKYKEVQGRPVSEQQFNQFNNTTNVDNDNDNDNDNNDNDRLNTNMNLNNNNNNTSRHSSRIQSSKKPLSRVNSQSNNEFMSTKRTIDDNNNNNNVDTLGKDEEFDQLDILTKQAIKQVKDHVSNFKTEVTSCIQDIRDKQEKVEIGEIKRKIKSIQTEIENDFISTREHTERDYNIIRNDFSKFKDEVFFNINEIHEESNRRLDTLQKEVKAYEKVINKKFERIEKRQSEYINLLKEILEKSKDETTVELAQKFLVDDKEIYERNKHEWEQQFEEEKQRKANELKQQYEHELQIQKEVYDKEIKNEAKEEVEYERLKMIVDEKENELLNKKKEIYIKEAEEMLRDEKDNATFGNKYRDDQYNKDNEIIALENELSNQIHEYYRRSQLMQLSAELPDLYPPIPQFIVQPQTHHKQPTPVVKEKEVVVERQKTTQRNDNNDKSSLNKNTFIHEYTPKHSEMHIKSEQSIQDLNSSVGYVGPTTTTNVRPVIVPNNKTRVFINDTPINKEVIQPINNDTYSSVVSINNISDNALPPNQPTPPIMNKQIQTPIKYVDQQQQQQQPLPPPEQINPTSPLPFHALYKQGKPATMRLLGQHTTNAFNIIFKTEGSLNITKIRNATGANKEKAENITRSINDRVSYVLSSVQSSVDNMDEHTKNLLHYILKTNLPLVPYRFFTEYEYKRLRFNNEGKLMRCSIEQKQMIIAFYVFIKQLVYWFFNEHKNISKQALETIDELSKENIKIIGSVIFHKTIELFGNNSLVPVVNSNYPGRDALEDTQAMNDENVKGKLNRAKKILAKDDEIEVLYKKLYSKEELEVFDRVQTPYFNKEIREQMFKIVRDIDNKI